MYLPGHFAENEGRKIRELIAGNSFVTLLSFPPGESVFINHLPVIFSSAAGEDRVLIGHMAKRNPQWRHFESNAAGTMIVQGPHTYITPQWYRSGRDVPTWNYAVAHLQGRIEIVSAFAGQVEILKQLTQIFESANPQPWEFELPDDLLDESSLTSAIVSFKFHIEKVEAKFKLSQNRSAADREGVLAGLQSRTDEMSHAVRALMLDSE